MQLGGPPPDFLAALRRRGIALGLDQLQRLGRLSERWEGDDEARSAAQKRIAQPRDLDGSHPRVSRSVLRGAAFW